MTPIERVAAAMAERRRQLIAKPLTYIWDDLARAAISALREPTPEMVKAGELPTIEMPLGNGTTTRIPGLGANPYSMWVRMIDAALNEAPAPSQQPPAQPAKP